MLTGKAPFEGKDKKEIFDKIIKKDFSIFINKIPNISNESKNLLHQLLIYEYDKRPSAKKVITHRWFSFLEN